MKKNEEKIINYRKISNIFSMKAIVYSIATVLILTAFNAISINVPNKPKHSADKIEDFPDPIFPIKQFVPLLNSSSESRCDLQFFTFSFVII